MIKILALDFDGVICNGLLEYFQSSKFTYNEIWHEEKIINDDLAEIFYQLRSVIETGWEMPILLRALILNFSPQEILQNWSNISQKIIISEGLEPKYIGEKLDNIRQLWLDRDLKSWLALHTFYDGIIEQLKYIINSEIKLYIITTKEGRFVKQLLQEKAINLPDNFIIGKEKKLPKYESLRQIIAKHNIKPAEICFIEDRLPALQLVKQQPDLQEVSLFLAAWGYNSEDTRNSLSNYPDIQLLSLQQFCEIFKYFFNDKI